jgi:DME family drug/metabolite transporter
VDVGGLGVALALASSATYSLYLVGADAVTIRTDALTTAVWVSGSAGVATAIFAVVTGNFSWPRGWHQWMPMLGMAVFTSGAFVCLFAGLRRLGALRMAILSATEPLTASVLAAIFLGERIGPWTVVGGGFILSGAIAASVARRDVRPEPPGP